MIVPIYRIEFFEDVDGDCPMVRWLLEELPEPQASALGIAMNHILQRLGPDVVETRYGKALGQGLYEFRLDESIDELLSHLALTKKRKLLSAPPGRMLFRVFFHPYGDKILLLLGGYDKGKTPSKHHQNEQIQLARARLKRWKSTRQGGSKS